MFTQIKKQIKKLISPKVFTDAEKYKSIRKLFDQYAKQTGFYIETGTEHGHSIEMALSAGFQKIFGIELDRNYVDECREKFTGYEGVTIFQGRSDEVLPRLLRKLDCQCVVWLDAHPGTVDEPWPLLDELSLISEHHIKNHILLIDDIRHLGKGVVSSREEVIQSILAINKDYKIAYADGRIKNDIMIAKA